MNQETSTFKALLVGTCVMVLLFLLQMFLRFASIQEAMTVKMLFSLKSQIRFTSQYVAETWLVDSEHSKIITNTLLFGETSKDQVGIAYST
jgi:dolichyl-phosphate-mannose--protein O-mannosyl transferase